ncbi:TPA: hypothetical protein I8627_003717 [Citrobacter freundii]|uniref:Uncharacterized protein n=2 Tax=Enterobacteriaceae TaxID=543 RepID=A0AA40NJX9_CITFR|nr:MULTISPECIES: hypothetical protein [Citrobacter freundii complex]MBT1791018.1 hypothetical protein [Enterobacter hormaechei subsp. xiangfangensis]MCM8479530.1 hypothetical protein [Enterobacter hormaechei]EKX5046459.1 hypothetical protein [Citrobacter freundii]KPR55434.1 hypothetical protein AN672_11470 [Citrobacter freundii]PJG37989.1 hypothetical protein CGZ54_20155 [Enterobacter hormaechei]
MNKILLIAALEEIASREGHELNGQDKLVIRTKTAMVLAAKQRHRQRMKSPPYQWRKPDKLRR